MPILINRFLSNRRMSDLGKCVVWTTIPGLSWVCPALGHVGVTDSSGCTYDFEGPYTIGRGQMIFGNPMQKWKINIDDETWDSAIEEVSRQFQHVNYDLICSNCHYFAAAVLDKAGVEPLFPFSGRWVNGATVKIIHGLVLHGRTISGRYLLAIWAPFVAILFVVLYFYFHRL